MSNSRGIIHLIPLFVVLAILGVVGFFLISGKTKLPFEVPFLTQKPNVKIQKQYSNPLSKETQYVNPFNEFKNPFTVSK